MKKFDLKLEKFKDELNELPVWLQKLIKKWLKRWYITEDEILSEIDEIDKQIEILEKFYDLADKLNIKIETIEDILEKELKATKKQQNKLWKVSLTDKNYKINDKQYKDFIKLYFSEIANLPLLTPEEEKKLAILAKKWDEQARKKLIEGNLRLVISIAKKFIWSKIPFLDLIQEWNVWLIKAIEKFDPDKGFKFSTYATWWIRQHIVKAIAEMWKSVRIPIHVIDEISNYQKAYQELFQKLWREPTSKEIAEKLGYSESKILNIEKILKWDLSINTPLWDDWKQNIGDIIEDKKFKKPDEYVETLILKEKLKQILDMLDERERKIIKMRFWIDWRRYTLEEIAREFWITRERVRQIEAKVLQKLREHDWLLALLGLEDEKEKFFERLKKWKIKKVKWIPKSLLKKKLKRFL